MNHEKIDSFGYYDFCRFDVIALITHTEIEPISVLEIGCSSGGTLAKITDIWKNAIVKGVEIVPDIATIAQNRGLDVICRNIENDELPYEMESFDYIIIADVIEHLYDPDKVLQELLLYMKKGGKYLCSVPNIQHISIVNDLMKGKFEYVDAGILDKTHIRFFTLHSVKQLFSRLNMVIEFIQGVTWSMQGPLLTDIINEEITSQKLFEFQQILISARKV